MGDIVRFPEALQTRSNDSPIDADGNQEFDYSGFTPDAPRDHGAKELILVDHSVDLQRILFSCGRPSQFASDLRALAAQDEGLFPYTGRGRKEGV